MPAIGQRTRFERLLDDETYSRVWRYAARLSSTREDAEDLLQDSLTVAVRKFGSLRDESRFAGWLLSIVRRKFIDRYRRASARISTSDLPEQLTAIEMQTGEDPLGMMLESGLAKLPPEQRELLGLFYLDGLNLKETGEVLGIPAKAVRQRLYRARQTLRRIIEQAGIPEAGNVPAVGEFRGGGDNYGS